MSEREKERVVGSCLSFNIPGYTDEFCRRTHVSCCSSSASSRMVKCSDVVSGNIIATASSEQPTFCCLSQVSMSPSSVPPEESSQKGRYFLVNFIQQVIEAKHFFFFYTCSYSCRFSCFLYLLYCNK